jgi:N4-gp56 family major capsid protein
MFGKRFMLLPKNTDTVAFRRQENLNSDPVVLPEDSDPAPEQVVDFTFNVTMQEFGKVVLLSRKVLLVVEDDTAYETADNLSQCMHTMLDKVTRAVWASAVPEISCLNGANGNAITELTQDDWDRAIAYLDSNDTEKMAPMIEGTSRFGTGPIEEAFWVTAHVDVKPDIRALDQFVPTSLYGAQDTVLQAELGAVQESRIVTSTLVNKSTDSPPQYSNNFIGANAIGYVEIDEVSTEIIMKPLGFNDYLNRFQSMGFTAWFNAAVLDDSHIVNLLSTKA